MDSVQKDDRLALVEVAAMLYRQKAVIVLAFCVSLILSLGLIWAKPLGHDFNSVFVIGTRGLDAPLERPDLLIERLEVIHVPKALAAHRGKWREAGRDDLNLQVLYKAGSQMFKLYTLAPQERAVDVQALHQDILQQVLTEHAAALARIQLAWTKRKAAQQDIVDQGKTAMPKMELAEERYKLVSLTSSLDNISPSSINMMAVSGVKQMSFSRGQLTGFAAVFCALLALLAGGVSIFIQAVRARLV